ncbi:MAG: DUF3524 domain-containing protein [Anaerohalosphaeraceae bacterium]|nr:DUF3524 domain-containing protein [Anaerohalosphaeraceae bacterium]
MKILALEPYYGGSHQAFLEGLSAHSCHQWDVYKLAPHKWKWRMRHSAITFAEQVRADFAQGRRWDVVFCSDMLNLAEFLGLAGHYFQQLPSIAYFHENQLTYPAQFESERDYQFVMTNMTTALAANEVWFNSEFHRDSFLAALEVFLKKMPDEQPLNSVERILRKSVILSPGVAKIQKQHSRKSGPAQILWAGRWEHDKNPEDFFRAVKILKDNGCDFVLNVIGEQFRQSPEIFEWAKDYFSGCINRWGYQQSHSQYIQALKDADIFVSTAVHEFFGITAVEAALAGAHPLLPNRLAYPEIFRFGKESGSEEFFYDGSVADLAEKLFVLIKKTQRNHLWNDDKKKLVESLQRYVWGNLIVTADVMIEKLSSSASALT